MPDDRFAEELCRACGFCCNGTLFQRVPLAAGDVVATPRLTVITEEATGRRFLRQPCTALDGLDCSAYATRPQACRAYRCDLLNALSEGEVSIDEAKDVVHRTREAMPDQRAFLIRQHFTGWRGG